MNKLLNIFLIVLVASMAACTSDPLEDLDGNGWKKERNVVSVLLEGQIGTAIIEREADDAKITLTANLASITDISKVEIEGIEFSYGATSSSLAGTTLDFTSGSTSISVVSGAGETLDWKVVLNPFINEIEGSWTISSYYIKWDDGNGWGNAGGSELNSLLAASTPGLDDIITFGPVEGADDEGRVYGNFERTTGADGEVASFIYERTNEDWTSRFNQIPVGSGEWLLNKDNSITITVDGMSYTTLIFEKTDDSNLKLPLAPGAPDSGKINWDDYYGDHTNKFCVTTELYYELVK
ncbi:hypothetical protein [Ancylomarina sp. 16SWW S1-10-2]|uniref:hypothetical protein n=1 Tax=Ancylomarina sp. 16SWW S1-10-2 TaxID=2499681 RepID=UPI0012AE9063|nr:hypothetical protein [Ancylomarina sp. 16SWW S1-10-2]MRT93712.1 hypothetical protein [Ancylomarina sp. 16SWW S1-10-2]